MTDQPQLTSISTPSPHDKTYRNYYVRVTLGFCFFIFFAAPLEFHVTWYSALTSSEPHGVAESFFKGSLYFFAIIACVEAAIRLEHYHKLLYKDSRVYTLRCLLSIPVISAFFQYFVTDYYRVGTPASLPPSERYVQLGTALAALCLSLVVHHVITVTEAKRVR